MAIVIVKDNDVLMPVLTFGVVSNEVGINISRFTVRYYPEVNETIAGPQGLTKWRVVSQQLSREVTCEGEITSTIAGGVLSWTTAMALTFANSPTHFSGSNIGTFYLDEATVVVQRRAWATVVIKASARPTL